MHALKPVHTGDYRRKVRQSPFSATVALFCYSRRFRWQCGQGFRMLRCCIRLRRGQGRGHREGHHIGQACAVSTVHHTVLWLHHRQVRSHHLSTAVYLPLTSAVGYRYKPDFIRQLQVCQARGGVWSGGNCPQICSLSPPQKKTKKYLFTANVLRHA